jgi:hypothetical protein
MLQHFETLNHTVSRIKHPYEKPNFVFMPDPFHDKNPFKIYILEFFKLTHFFDFLLFSAGVELREVLSESFLHPTSKSSSL